VSLRLRLTVLLLALAVVLVVAGIVVGSAVERVDRNREQVATVLLPASVQSRAVLVALVDQETGQRGFVITGDTDFLDPYRRGNRELQERLDMLRDLLGSEPAMVAAIDAVGEEAERWRTVAARPEIAARRSGDRERAADLVATGRGRAAFEQVRERVDELQTRIDARVAQAQAAADEDLDLLRRAVAVSGLLIAAILGLAAVLLRRWALLPVQRLRARMRAVAAGNLDDEVLVAGPPEIAAIGRDAESMRRRIVAELDAARGATEALGQHSPVVAALGSELGARGAAAHPSFDVAGSVMAAEGVLAGDTWEALLRPDGSLAVMVLDVSGHGAEAGLVAFGFKQRLAALLRTDLPLAEAFTGAAEWADRDDERFLTCLVVVVEPDGRASWVNAGHPPGVVVSRADRRLRAELPPTGPLVSWVASGWTVGHLDLRPEDLVVLCTDGVSEARDAHGVELGTEGVVAALGHLDPWTAAAAVEEVRQATRRFAVDVRRDDVTAVALRLTSQPAPPCEPMPGADSHGMPGV
jgi:sigma-B regulation protein RsbU (phosphoserine phosphatase)